MIKIGDRLFWHDPDADSCSGYGKVTSISGEIITLDKEDGGEVEALPHELSRTELDERLSEDCLPDVTVVCKFCGKEVPETTAHLHTGAWVGDECCWDERLRSSE